MRQSEPILFPVRGLEAICAHIRINLGLESLLAFVLALCFGQICLNRQKRHLLLVDHHLSCLVKLGFELFPSFLIQARAY